jgi:hypothetical protein
MKAIYVSDKLHKQLKKEALQRETTITALVAEKLECKNVK